MAQGLLAGTYALSFAGLYYSLTSRNAALHDSAAFSNYTQKVHAAAHSYRHFLELWRTHGTVAEIDSARRDASTRLAQSRSAARTQISPEESAELERLSRFIRASGHILDKIKRLDRAGRHDETAALYRTGLSPVIRQYMGSAITRRLEEEQTSRLENERQVLVWTRISVAAIALCTALSSLIFFLWTRGLIAYASGNLLRIERALAAIRSGNFQISIEPTRADEFGALCTSLKSVAARLDQAQTRLNGVTELADESSRSLNEVLFAVSEYLALARQKDTLDAEDSRGLQLILERTKRCNLLLERLCTFAAGQRLLTEQSPEIVTALKELEAALTLQGAPPK